MNIELSKYYQWGNSLRADAPTYVERTADQELLESLKIGEYCYILNAPQMGKSSLMLRTKSKLERQGFVCATISLKTLGKDYLTSDVWYKRLFISLVQKLNLSDKLDCEQWWQQQEPPVNKLLNFVDEILLRIIPHTQIFVFFDEIEIPFEADFKVDDFFKFVRICYKRRTKNIAYCRLNFALFGVAKLSALNANFQIIARTIELTRFEISKTKPLAHGLVEKARHPYNVLKEILDWTGGQPYLTQRICDLVVKHESYIKKGEEIEKIARIVKTQIINSWKNQERRKHLDNIEISLLQENPTKIRRLALYQKIWRQGEIIADQYPEFYPEQIELQLTGIVVKEKGVLRVFNPIYKEIFDEDWVTKLLTNDNLIDVNKIRNWLASQEQDESQLLYGQELEKVWKWAKDKYLTKQEQNLLVMSQLFNTITKERLGNISNYELVIEAVFSWTGGQKKLNDFIFQLANSYQLPEPGNETAWVDDFMRSQILDKWQTHQPKHPLAEFRNQLLLVHIDKLTMLSEQDKTDIAEVFQEWIPRLEKKSNRIYSSLIEKILLWTKPNPALVGKLCQLICDANIPIPVNDEAKYIQKIVQIYWINQWETQANTQPIREMCDRLLNNLNFDPLRLLIRYRQILLNEVVLEDNCQEDEELLRLKLVDKISGILSVANLTYKSIFDSNWLDEAIAKISRPYNPRKLIAWLDSKRKDTSHLLMGEELQKTQLWADTNKDLVSELERDFIIRSILAKL